MTLHVYGSALLPVPRGMGVGIARQNGDVHREYTLLTLRPDLWYNLLFSPACLDDPICVPTVFAMTRSPWSQKAGGRPE